ncbi:MAG: hypothetical protein PVJ02_11420, partial [Gemmatimonadota bacterium]
DRRTRSARQPSASRGVRVSALATVGVLVLLAGAATVAGQSRQRWTFGDDAFADLWFHGLAVVGFYGFGPFPLYDPDYALAAAAERRADGTRETPLELRRGDFRGSFQRDEAFEILHFVPLYFAGRDPREALRSLSAVASLAPGTLPQEGDAAATAVASVLTRADERRTLGDFVRALDEEWTRVVLPRRTENAAGNRQRLLEIRHRWTSVWAPALTDFLSREGFQEGSVVVVPALGAEGRFLDRNPAGTPGPLVVVGDPGEAAGTDAALSSLVRELCYPAVRRAFAPFEGRVSDRVAASRASDLTATRCGELLLEARAPAQVAAYRARFDLPPGGAGRAFLSASGDIPGAAAWEGTLEEALLRELNLDPDAAGVRTPSVGGNPQ